MLVTLAIQYFHLMGTSYQIRNQEAIYYLTFQVVVWADVFSRKSYRDILIDSFEYCRREKGLVLYAYVIMTNHVHLIARSSTENLSDFVRDFKKHTSKQVLKEIESSGVESRRAWLEIIFKDHAKYNKRSGDSQLWTHDNHSVELDTNEMIESRLNYIHQNPVRAGWVNEAEDYIYSSARNYADLESLLQIDII